MTENINEGVHYLLILLVPAVTMTIIIVQKLK